MSTKDFTSHDWSSENGTATGLMQPGESLTVSGIDGPHGIFDGSYIPDVQSISLDNASFPEYALYKYTVTLIRIRQDTNYEYYFKDESGDTYKLSSIAGSGVGSHEVSYNSDRPNIVEIGWQHGF
jgi:hypothetical protein